MSGDRTADDEDGDGERPETYTLEFVEEGATVECRADEYVLDAADAAGLDVPYGCLSGLCTICSARVEGEVDQSEGVMLLPDEEAAGYALLCVAYPRSDLVIHTDEGP